MTNANTKSQEDKQCKKGDRPTHLVNLVTEEGKILECVGAAWERKDGKGMNIHLKVYPLEGFVKIHRLRDRK